MPAHDARRARPRSGLGVSALVPPAERLGRADRPASRVHAGAHAGDEQDLMRAVTRPLRWPLLGGRECCRQVGKPLCRPRRSSARRGHPTVTAGGRHEPGQQGELLAADRRHVLRDARHHGGRPRGDHRRARRRTSRRHRAAARRAAGRSRSSALASKTKAVSSVSAAVRRTSSGIVAGLSWAALPARLSLRGPLGLLDSSALLGGLLINGLLDALRAIDRAVERIEHARPGGSAGSLAARRSRARSRRE